MKIAGWIILSLGSLSFLGQLFGHGNVLGPLFWMALGIFLIVRDKQKKKERQAKEDWANGKDNASKDDKHESGQDQEA